MPHLRAALVAIAIALAACGKTSQSPGPGCGSCADGGDASTPDADPGTPDLAVVEADLSPDVAPDRASAEPDAAPLPDAEDDGPDAMTGSLDAAPGRLVLDPMVHQFMDTALGDRDSFLFTVGNPGGSPLSGLEISVTGGDFAVGNSNGCWGRPVLEAGASCTFSVDFRPQSSGGSSGKVSASAGGHTVTSIVNGFSFESHLSISPAAPPSFTTQVGSTSAVITFTVSSVGGSAGAAVTMLAGANAADFFIASNDCKALYSGSICQIQVAFRPLAVGMKSAQLVVSTAAGATVVANLSGTATP